MLINFIGSPHSGKTTLAARLFDQFKNDDIASEFITERARQYIVEKRFRERLVAGQRVYLTDEDQLGIMKQQMLLEAAYHFTVPKQTIILSDSSPINTLMYLSPEGRQRPEARQYVEANLKLNPVVFWARVTPGTHSSDTNRIHGEIISRKLDEDLPQLLQEFAPDLKVIEVCGTPSERYNQAICHLLSVFGVDP